MRKKFKIVYPESRASDKVYRSINAVAKTMIPGEHIVVIQYDCFPSEPERGIEEPFELAVGYRPIDMEEDGSYSYSRYPLTEY